MFQVKIVPLFSGMKLQEKIVSSDVLFEKLCVVEDTVTSAEEQPLLKEWHLPLTFHSYLASLPREDRARLCS